MSELRRYASGGWVASGTPTDDHIPFRLSGCLSEGYVFLGSVSLASVHRITVAEAAKKQSVTERTIRRWITDGHLPFRVIGGKRMVHPLDVEKVAEKMKPSPRVRGWDLTPMS